MFYSNKDMDNTLIFQFPSSDLQLAQNDLSWNHDKPTGDKQFLCKVRTSYVSPYEWYGTDMIPLTDRQGDPFIHFILSLWDVCVCLLGGGS